MDQSLDTPVLASDLVECSVGLSYLYCMIWEDGNRHVPHVNLSAFSGPSQNVDAVGVVAESGHNGRLHYYLLAFSLGWRVLWYLFNRASLSMWRASLSKGATATTEFLATSSGTPTILILFWHHHASRSSHSFSTLEIPAERLTIFFWIKIISSVHVNIALLHLHNSSF